MYRIQVPLIGNLWGNLEGRGCTERVLALLTGLRQTLELSAAVTRSKPLCGHCEELVPKGSEALGEAPMPVTVSPTGF